MKHCCNGNILLQALAILGEIALASDAEMFYGFILGNRRRKPGFGLWLTHHLSFFS